MQRADSLEKTLMLGKIEGRRRRERQRMRWSDGITDLKDMCLSNFCPRRNSRIPPQLEKRHVVPPSSQDEALAPYSVSREKEMATHSSVLAWRIPGMVEPGGLPCMGSHRVGHD